MKNIQLIPAQGVEHFFYEELQQALARQHLAAAPHTEFYLVRLLSNFCLNETLHHDKQQAELPLAIRYLQSLQAHPQERFRLLKQLGDFTLYISGFFQDSLNLRQVDLKYYITLGGCAYQKLHAITAHQAFREVFQDLANNFLGFVDVLSEVSENSRMSKNSDLLKMYEKWLSTGSDRLLKKLQEVGIFPHQQSSEQH